MRLAADAAERLQGRAVIGRIAMQLPVSGLATQQRSEAACICCAELVPAAFLMLEPLRCFFLLIPLSVGSALACSATLLIKSRLRRWHSGMNYVFLQRCRDDYRGCLFCSQAGGWP